jgi:hypothetical protein
MSNASPLEYLRPAEAAKRLGIPEHIEPILGKGSDSVLTAVSALHLISTAELARFYSATAQPVPASMVRAA